MCFLVKVILQDCTNTISALINILMELSPFDETSVTFAKVVTLLNFRFRNARAIFKEIQEPSGIFQKRRYVNYYVKDHWDQRIWNYTRSLNIPLLRLYKEGLLHIRRFTLWFYCLSVNKTGADVFLIIYCRPISISYCYFCSARLILMMRCSHISEFRSYKSFESFCKF